MKTLIKYPLSLFILLLIGYSQLFAPLYRGRAPFVPAKKITASTQRQNLDAKTTDLQTILIADEEVEDDEKDSIKKYSEECSASLLPYSLDYFYEHIKSDLSFYKLFFNAAFSIPPYLIFCVFRL